MQYFNSKKVKRITLKKKTLNFQRKLIVFSRNDEKAIKSLNVIEKSYSRMDKKCFIEEKKVEIIF